MHHFRRFGYLAAATIVSGAAIASLAGGAPGLASVSHGTTTTLCRKLQRMYVHGRHHSTFILRNDNFGNDRECLTNRNAWPNFVVSLSRASSTGPESRAYPELMLGCAWGLCTPHTRLPERVSRLTDPESTWYLRGKAPGGWIAGYDLWFAKGDYSSGQDHGAEIMIWLKTTFPAPRRHARLVRIHGVRYWLEHWYTRHKGSPTYWSYILFRRVKMVSRVRDLKFRPFIARAVRAGLLDRRWWLTSIDSGFEIWHGGKGLATLSYWARA
jgi:hypothetical protein